MLAADIFHCKNSLYTSKAGNISSVNKNKRTYGDSFKRKVESMEVS